MGAGPWDSFQTFSNWNLSPLSLGQLIASGVVTIPSYEDREVGFPWTPTKLFALYPTGRIGQLA